MIYKSSVPRNKQVESFGFSPGEQISNNYQIVSRLGGGWESEVYIVKERRTGIERAAKFFLPQRNLANRTANRYARKLHKLRKCPILIQYHTQEEIVFDGHVITVLISDYVEGELLSKFIKRQPGKRLSAFQGLHLLYALATGLEAVHQHKEYHGDLHTDNVIVSRYGLTFDLKLLDLFHWGPANKTNYQADICDLIRIFYDAIGGRKFYAKQPPEIKYICCGLKKSLILERFRSLAKLRSHLENINWANGD